MSTPRLRRKKTDPETAESDSAPGPAASGGVPALSEVDAELEAMVARRQQNLAIWNRLEHTDPRHTKPFKRAGGFKGTAIKPIWSQKMMTQEFGPIGKGWGILSCDFSTYDIQQSEEVLVFCQVELWWADQQGHKHAGVIGIGGDKIVVRVREKTDNRNAPPVYYWNTDDEAYKKSYTDAMTNAMKLLGIAADVHMGQFDDSKYVDAMFKEFAQRDADTMAKEEEDSAARAHAKAADEAADYFDRMIKSAQEFSASADLKAFLEAETENFTANEAIDPDTGSAVRVQLSHMMRGLKAAEHERQEKLAATGGNKPGFRSANPMFDRLRNGDVGEPPEYDEEG